MPKANAIASELRKIADLLDRTPDAEITKPNLGFYHVGTEPKEQFIALAKVFPRPFDKGDGYSHDQYTLTHETDNLRVYASIDRSEVCTLIEPARPARYECTPLLSLEEEESLGAF